MHVKLRDLNISVPAADHRQIEIIASGLGVFGGARLAVDATLRSCCTIRGQPRPKTDWKDGAVAEDARSSKEKVYPELAESARCKLVVLAVETGGRFSKETADFVQTLADARAAQAPAHLRATAARAYERRWSRLIGMTAANAFAASLLANKGDTALEHNCEEGESWLPMMLAENRHSR